MQIILLPQVLRVLNARCDAIGVKAMSISVKPHAFGAFRPSMRVCERVIRVATSALQRNAEFFSPAKTAIAFYTLA
jgi:hypothetical protein